MAEDMTPEAARFVQTLLTDPYEYARVQQLYIRDELAKGGAAALAARRFQERAAAGFPPEPAPVVLPFRRPAGGR